MTTTIILDLVLDQVSQCINTLFFWLSINMMCAHFLVPCLLFTLLQRENEARIDETGLVSINSQNNINIQKRKSHREWNRCVHITILAIQLYIGTTTFWKVGKSCSWHTIAVYWFLGFVYEWYIFSFSRHNNMVTGWSKF